MGCLDLRGNCYTGRQDRDAGTATAHPGPGGWSQKNFRSQLWGTDIEFMTFCHSGNMKILKFIDGEFYDPSWCVEYHRL